jgi:hypothetical protein
VTCACSDDFAVHTFFCLLIYVFPNTFPCSSINVLHLIICSYQGARTIAITYSNSLFTRTTCEAAKLFALEQASIPYQIGTHCAALYCTVLYCTVLYCTVLYCTVLYCTVLYCTVLYCRVFFFILKRSCDMINLILYLHIHISSLISPPYRHLLHWNTLNVLYLTYYIGRTVSVQFTSILTPSPGKLRRTSRPTRYTMLLRTVRTT